MGVTAVNAYSTGTGNGSATDFPFTFEAMDTAEVAVQVEGVVQSSGYSVALNDGGAGGTVTFSTAPADAAEIVIYSTPLFTQGIDFGEAGAFLPSSHDDATDRDAIRAIYLRDRMLASLRAPVGEAIDEMPAEADRAGKFLVFDAGGNPAVSESDSGADSTLRTDLAASSGSTLLGFLQAGLGAIARSVQSWVRERSASVADFGATTASGDNAAAFQAALDSGATRVFVPKGTWALSAVTVPSGVEVYGSFRGTYIKPIDHSSTVFTLMGFNLIHRLEIQPDTQRTGGKYFDISNSGEIVLEKLRLTRGFQIADISGSASGVTLDKVLLLENNNNGAADLITIDTIGAAIVINKLLADNSGAKPRSGIRIRSCGDVTITDSNLINCGTDLLIDPPSGKVVASVLSSDTFFDTATKGVSIKPEAGGAVVRCHFQKPWGGSHTGHGIEIDGTDGTIDGIYLVDPQVNLNGGDGIRLTGANARNITILGGQGGQNIGSAFRAEASANKFTVKHFTAGATDALAGNDKGISIASGASDFDVSDNICTGNTSVQCEGAIPTLASAATVAIPARGKTFSISGTTGISALSGGYVGRRITLHFQGIVTVTHGTGSTSAIRLNGAVNFTSAAGSSLSLEHNGTYWAEVGRAA